MVPLSTLQRKGLLTLTLLQSARFAAPAADAVAYWKTHPKFSERFAGEGGKFGSSGGERDDEDGGSGSSAGGPFARALRRATAREAAQCSASGDSADADAAVCSAPPPRPGLPPATLYPRSRLAKRVGVAVAGDDELEDCLRRRCPACLDIRGGHLSHSAAGAAEAASGAAAGGAAATAAAAAIPFGLPLNLWKVLFQAILTTLNVLCWLIPLKSERISSNKLALSLANAFSGGVFLSLAFGHLIPECVHGFPTGEPEGYNEALPYMLVLGGYLLIFFVEKVAFDAHGLMHAGEDGHDERGHHTHGHARSPHSSSPPGSPSSSPDKKTAVAAAATANGSAKNKAPATAPAMAEAQAEEDSNKEGLNSGRSAVILLGALAVHSVLEMTALGLSNTFGESALLSLSIALHQPAESIALLVAFLKSGMPRPRIIRYLSVFSAMGPLGVALGMAVNEFAAPIVDAIMLAVVAGTFVYVGATEVIPEEWEDPEGKWIKFAALMMGIGSIFAITQYTMTLEA